MDLTTIIVLVVLTALFLGGILWMELHSRRTKPDDPSTRAVQVRARD